VLRVSITGGTAEHTLAASSQPSDAAMSQSQDHRFIIRPNFNFLAVCGYRGAGK
jgi:hypothetical protein